MARRSGEIRKPELDISPLSTMECIRGLGECRHCTRRDYGGKHRFDFNSRPCLGSGRKRGIHHRGLGRSRGGFTSKVHCIADALGRPIAFHITPGQTADITAYETLIDLPEKMLKAFLADNAYDADRIRGDLKTRDIESVVPPRLIRKVDIPFDHELYRQRNYIERVFGHLKINRSIATRYDQLAETFLSTLHIASARYWLKFVHAA